MKKSNLTLSALLALGVALAGCNNDENMPGGENNDRVAIRVNSNISVATPAHAPISRAAGTKWDADDAIGIYAFFIASDIHEDYANVKYITADGNGAFLPASTPEGKTIYLPTNGTALDFGAYYPYQGLTGHKYEIDLSNQDIQKAIDLMVAERVKGIDKTKPDVKFHFNHRLSRVSLNIKAGDEFSDNTVLEGMTVTLTGQQAEGTYDVLTDMISVTGNATDIDLLTAANGQSAEAIVMPSENYTGMQFVFKTLDGEWVWALDNSQANPKKFVEGHEYIYNITLHKTGIKVTASINEWEHGNGENGENGDAY